MHFTEKTPDLDTKRHEPDQEGGRPYWLCVVSKKRIYQLLGREQVNDAVSSLVNAGVSMEHGPVHRDSLAEYYKIVSNPSEGHPDLSDFMWTRKAARIALLRRSSEA